LLLLWPQSQPQLLPPQLPPQQQKIRMMIRISQMQEQLLLLPVEKHIYVTSLAEVKTFYAAQLSSGPDQAKKF
jgi:ABC-type uncharacterized transport system permease subunit